MWYILREFEGPVPICGREQIERASTPGYMVKDVRQSEIESSLVGLTLALENWPMWPMKDGDLFFLPLLNWHWRWQSWNGPPWISKFRICHPITSSYQILSPRKENFPQIVTKYKNMSRQKCKIFSLINASQYVLCNCVYFTIHDTPGSCIDIKHSLLSGWSLVTPGHVCSTLNCTSLL